MTQPETLPLACPSCRSECKPDTNYGLRWAYSRVACQSIGCQYRGPTVWAGESSDKTASDCEAEAIAKHNALCSPDKPEAEAAIPISEIRAMWAPLESLPPLEMAGKLMSGLAALVTKYQRLT